MKNLIEKYFKGETNLEEEARLRDYFNSEEVDESLRPYQPLFRFFEAERQHVPGDDFDRKLLARMENEAGIVKMKPRHRNLLRIAAAAAIALGVLLFLQKTAGPSAAQTTGIDWSKYEITDEQVAYEQTVKALKLVSEKLNKGSAKTSQEIGKIEKISKYFD